MKFFLPLFLSAFFSAYMVHGQCPESASPKAVKLTEKARDKKKYEFRERMDFLKSALEEDPDYADAQYEMGMMQVSLAIGNGTGFNAAKKYLEKSLELCPEVNGNASFYLGQIAWGAEDYEACIRHMTRFLDRPQDAKKPEDLDKAQSLLDKSKFYDTMFKKKVPFNPVPVKNICTYEDEFLPMLSPDNEILFFTHRYMKQGKDVLFPTQVEELSESVMKNGEFSKPEMLDLPFNTIGDNYGGVSFSIDNQHIYITICKPGKKGYMNCDIYSSDMGREGWLPFKNLGPNINTEDGWEAQPSLSSDGLTLYFAGARADGKGMDIYKSTRSATNEEWQPAVNMGAPVNTDKNEKSPFIHSDSQTLYFCSDGHSGMGGYDIFYARAPENGKFSKPVNIGYPINSEKDETGFFVSTDGHLGYLSSKDLKGKGAGGWDIYHFDLHEEARPEKIMFLRGQLNDLSGSLVSNTRIEIETVKSRKVTTVQVDSVSGKYATVVTLKGHEDAVMTVKRPGYGFQSTYLKAGDTTLGKPVKINMDIKPVEKGAVFTINNINYQSNSSQITDESKIVLDKFADYLNENEGLSIEIRGHTDNVGNPQANMALSTDRAFTVMDYLLNKGIPKPRLGFKGFGDSRPLMPNNTDAGRAMNRRTEFVIINTP